MFARRRPSTLKPLVALALFVLAVTVSACAPHKPTQSGFLTDAPAVKGQGYTSALIDPVEYRPVGRTPRKADPADMDALMADYRKELETAFAAHFRIATKPGPGVLRVRAAVTGYTLANPAWNAASLALPIGPRNGGISTEAEVVDARTGAPIIAQSKGFNGHLRNAGPAAMFDRDRHAETGLRQHARTLAEGASAATR
jgi:hypothetical protein